ncbi:ERF family protein [Exiguobacterium sp. BMC-KP]|uniref:ERF family protein n=1 Tax=Exiguobacterium sp. BMC-KP TaxID=1684312 RepID=UPI0006AA3480|nr:ERF family protein [Exiguobacterium sp. BMC-KP]
MKRSDSIASIAKALAAFQKDVTQPKKSAKNPHFKSTYVPLDNVVDSIAETAPKHGLSYIQTTVTENDKAGVQTLLMHESGEWIEFEPLLLPIGQKATPQAVGSAITYARRYTLSSIFGIASETDDDANGANDNASKNPTPPKPIMATKAEHETLNKLVDLFAGLRSVSREKVLETVNWDGQKVLERDLAVKMKGGLESWIDNAKKEAAEANKEESA